MAAKICMLLSILGKKIQNVTRNQIHLHKDNAKLAASCEGYCFPKATGCHKSAEICLEDFQKKLH